MKITRTQDDLIIDLITGLLFPEFATEKPKFFLTQLFYPLDPTVEFLLAGLGLPTPKYPLDTPVLDYPLDSLLKLAERGARLIHDLDRNLAEGKIQGNLFEARVVNDKVEFTCDNPAFTEFFLLFPQCMQAIATLVKKLIQSNPNLFRTDGFMIGSGFVCLFELLKRGIFKPAHAKIIGDTIVEISNQVEQKIARWVEAKTGTVDEIRVGELFYKAVLKACIRKFEKLDADAVRKAAFFSDQELAYIPNQVYQKTVKKLKQSTRLQELKIQFCEEYRSQNFAVEFSTEREGARREIKSAIVEYTSKLSSQAKPQKEVGAFLLEKLDSGGIDKYLKRADFDVKEIQKDSQIPLRTVKRFLKGLKELSRQKL
ncbi:MAG: hypothetical protein ACM3SR_07995 [Ignavibacteriales bacterium]